MKVIDKFIYLSGYPDKNELEDWCDAVLAGYVDQYLTSFIGAENFFRFAINKMNEVEADLIQIGAEELENIRLGGDSPRSMISSAREIAEELGLPFKIKQVGLGCTVTLYELPTYDDNWDDFSFSEDQASSRSILANIHSRDAIMTMSPRRALVVESLMSGPMSTAEIISLLNKNDFEIDLDRESTSAENLVAKLIRNITYGSGTQTNDPNYKGIQAIGITIKCKQNEGKSTYRLERIGK